MSPVKLLRLFFVLILFLVFFPIEASAQAVKTSVIVNPIRGQDFWQNNFDILDTSKKQYQVIQKNNLPSTWLVRYDALKNNQVVSFLKSFGRDQEVGLFLEITPTFATEAGIKYHESTNWHHAKSVLLIGYSPDDRVKLLDTAVKKYQEIFGVYPKSVGAWWIDAYSLNYLKQKYQIEVNLDVSDQFSTDQYQVWGQYYSTPFYPSKVNGLMPAQSEEQKLGVVTIQWATRDPFNAYGFGAYESTYSVQVNDYLLHDLNTAYFEKLLDIYPQTTIGLENDFSWEKYGREYENQINLLANKQKRGQIQIKNMTQYGQFYRSQNPQISPNVLITADDPLSSGGKVVWFMSPKYRLGLFYANQKVSIRDLRILNGAGEEECLKKACDDLKLSFSFSEAIDDVNYKTHYLIDEGSITDFQAVQTLNGAKISYHNQSGVSRTIELLPNDIKIDDTIKTIPSVILAVTSNTSGQDSGKIGQPVDLGFNWSQGAPKLAINFLKFIFLVIIFFFLPGWVFSRRLLLSIPVGLTIFTLVSYLIGYIKADYLIWSIPTISFLMAVKYGPPKVKLPKISLLLIFIILVGSLVWLTTVFRSGLIFNYGLGFWGPNGHDGLWHLSLISQLQKNVPPQNPVFAGETLNNYHYFFNLLVAKSGSIFGIDTSDLLFRFFPLLISLLSGLLMFSVTKKLFQDIFYLSEKTSFWGGIWATFFLYFAGGFGFLITLFKDGRLAGESAFWAQNARSTMLNPPFAISIVIFLTGLYIFYDFIIQKKWDLKKVILISLIWGSLIEFKAYGGILVLGSLGILGVERLIFNRDLKLLGIFVSCLVVTLIVFLPNNLGSTSLLVFQPLWLIYSMIVFPDRLGYERLSLALQSESNFKYIVSYLIGLAIFIFGNIGSRIFLLGGAKYLFRERFLLYLSILGFIFPMLFIQKGTNWNIVQFFYYTLLVTSIFAGLGVALIWQRLSGSLKVILTTVVLLVTLPVNYSIVYEYLPSRPPAKISTEEIEGLNFLKTQDKGIVMALTYDQDLKNKFLEPAPLYSYESTGYVSAFSNHTTFLEDTVNLEILGVDYKGRLNEVRDFIRFPEKSKEILQRNNIKYVYLVKHRNIEINEGKVGLEKIFDNTEIVIYSVI